MTQHLHFTVFFACVLLFVVQSSEGADIINGREVVPHSMPYMALIRDKGICGGILIDPKWVLTAAHCSGLKKVFLGVHSLNAEKKQERDIRGIKKSYPHPCYNRTEKVNDLMLLKLDKEVKRTKTVDFFNLKTAAEEPADGTKCTVAGWGQTDPNINETAKALMSATVNVINRRKCNSGSYYNYKPIITKDMICAGSNGNNKADTCGGDSGGPLLCGGQLVGITSFGKGCGRIHKPGVYTFLSAKYISWIRKTMKGSD